MTSYILIVDDEEFYFHILKLSLKISDYEFYYVSNGYEALEIMKNIQFDLVLLDIMMPGINGFQVCESLKNEPLTENIPIVFLSANTDPLEIEKGLNLGAIDYITKPFLVTSIRTKIDAYIALSEKHKLISQLHQKYQLMYTQVNLALVEELNQAVKGPLTIVKNGIYLISKLVESPDTRVSSYIQRSNIAVDELTRLTEMMLETILRKTWDPIELKAADIIPLLNKLLRSFKATSITKGIHLSLRLGEIDAECHVFIDMNHMEFMLNTLISNAMKYTKKGGQVILDFATVDKFLQFKVIDTGIGIQTDKLEALFEFRGWEPLIKAHNEEIDVSLYYIKRIINNLHGKITVDTEVGKGTTFTVAIPKLARISIANQLAPGKMQSANEI